MCTSAFCSVCGSQLKNTRLHVGARLLPHQRRQFCNVKLVGKGMGVSWVLHVLAASPPRYLRASTRMMLVRRCICCPGKPACLLRVTFAKTPVGSVRLHVCQDIACLLSGVCSAC